MFTVYRYLHFIDINLKKKYVSFNPLQKEVDVMVFLTCSFCRISLTNTQSKVYMLLLFFPKSKGNTYQGL